MQKTQNDVSIDAIACGFRSGIGERAGISFCLESAFASGFRFGFGEMAGISSRGGHVRELTYDYVKSYFDLAAPHDLSATQSEAPRSECVVPEAAPAIGSSSFITDATGYATQHLQYLPFGESWIDQQSGSFDTRYKFSTKELDDETQYSYFGARYYDSDLSVWLSVDPMSDKRSWISPYNYCQWNPVGRVDPTGALDWEPVVSNGRIYLKAEKGDNAETLKQFFGGSENAKKYIDESHLNNDKQYQGGELIKFKGTDKFSRAIQHARENPDKYVDGYNPETIMPDDDTPDDWSAGYSSLKPNYNCFSFARQTQTQDTWNFTTGESPPIDLKKEGYTPTAPSNVVFGQTIVFFGGLDKNTMTHAGVFFGVNSNKSMAYLFHKPDAHHVPILTPVSLNTLNVPRYGIVKGLYTK